MCGQKFLSVTLGGILWIGNTVAIHSQSRLDSLQHLDEVVVTVRSLPKGGNTCAATGGRATRQIVFS